MRFTLTHHLDRARSCEDDFVVAAHKRDYRLAYSTITESVDEFTAEFEGIARVAPPIPLLPADPFSPMCPAAPAHWKDSILWGIAAGTVEQPQVTPIPPEPLTPELLARAAPCTPREVYRIAATCVKGGCRHWRDGRDGAEGDGCCSLIERVIARYPRIVDDRLRPCGIRSVCRWFAQEGPPACRVCPGVCTDIGEIGQSPEEEQNVNFF
jgi:hypothetical protein